MSSKVFGIISYFPDPDTEYHKAVRNQRMKCCTQLLLNLSSLWSDIPIIIIAQNWRDYTPPIINNKITIYNYDRLGILNARRTLRQRFLSSDYDYLIMLEDDAQIECKEPAAYIREIDTHPDGVGVIRHYKHAMILCAISKFIYSQIDLPDIDVEQGEGFDDDIFVARCFGEFPDHAFDFSCNIKEFSHKGWCGDTLSTWKGESNYDLHYMVNVSETLISAAAHHPKPDDTSGSVDVVIPYVDFNDPIWAAEFTTATGITDPSPNRFRSWGTLHYLFRGIAKYMPFINNVFLIVSGESQVPNWIDTDTVKIIYHRDFIPAEFLPTFNSCTIESFLYNISDLSERIIYFNDDIFPIHPMTAADFFTAGKPNLRFCENEPYDQSKMYLHQCRSSLDLITNLLNEPKYPEGEILLPEHGAFPILRSSMVKVGIGCRNVIPDHISALRQNENVNQYIYHYYEYFTGNYVDDFCPYIYMEVGDDLYNLNKIVNIDEIKLVCLNDRGGYSDYEYVRELMIKVFEEKFPMRCKYEYVYE